MAQKPSKNWHWKSKVVSPWAKTWFESEVPNVVYTTEDVTIAVTKVTDVNGDAECGMRKSKLLSIFDLKVDLEWSAAHSNGSKATGKVTVPEVSHEVILDGLSDYVYEWSLDSSKDTDGPADPSPDRLYQLVKKTLPPKLEPKFAEFPKALIDLHGKDLIRDENAQSNGVGSVTAPAPSAAPQKPASVTTASAKSTPTASKAINTSTVTVDAQFMASADDLFAFLTDEQKIPMWSRSPAKSDPSPGASFSLFGGGVLGKYVSVDKPKGFVQSWALKSPSWPDNHEGKLSTKITQGADSTKLVLELSGVPKGQEDEIERNLTGYYINSLKSIGLGSQL